MKKKHFIFLGKQGLIYFCWLFIILFIGLIFAYEGTDKISWPSVIIITIFFLLLIYTFYESYYTVDNLKLPYRKKLRYQTKPAVIWAWKNFQVEKININKYQKYYLFSFNKNKQ